MNTALMVSFPPISIEPVFLTSARRVGLRSALVLFTAILMPEMVNLCVLPRDVAVAWPCTWTLAPPAMST